MPKNKQQRRVVGVYFDDPTLAWIDSQPGARGEVIAQLVERARSAQPFPDVARLTLELRANLDAIGNAVADAHDQLSEIETAAGLVGADGKRVDE